MFGPAVEDRDSDQEVFRSFFRVLHKNVEVSVTIEYSGIEQFVLKFLARAALTCLHQVSVRELRLRVLVEVPHVGMGWRAIEIEVVFLHILAVISFAVRQSEKAFFQNRISAVPQAQAKTEMLVVVGNACEPVLSPRYALERA